MDITYPENSSYSENIDDFEIEVNSAQAGQRFDRLLSVEFPEYSRSVISNSIKKGTILINGASKKAVIKLKSVKLYLVGAITRMKLTLPPTLFL